MKKIIILSVLFVCFFSCQSEENTLTSKNKALELANSKYVKREAGQIPNDLKFKENNILVVQGKLNFVDLLKRYKSQYATEDYYNNLFEITLNEVLHQKNVNELNNEVITFIIKEMDLLESNMLNMIHIPIIFNEGLKRGIITFDEYQDLSKNVIEKNEKELHKIQWSNQQIKDLTFKDFENMKFQLLHKRNKYQYILK